MALPTAAVAGLLSAAVTAPVSVSPGSPAGPLDFVTGALSLVSREVNRLTSPTSRRVRGALTTAGPAPAPAATTGSGTVTYSVTNDWGAGHTAALTLTAGQSALNGWTVEFDTPAQIVNIWNGQITG
ncbi:MAG: cellulose binding domain-containing protein, partial [Mycobacterium sp.]